MGTDFSLGEIQPKEARSGAEIAANSEIRENGQASLRILESATEFEELRDVWSAWSDGPEADLDFFSIRLRHRREVVRPHVMVVYRNGRPDCMLVGWLDHGPVTFNVGSLALFRSDARILRFVNGGFLGSHSQRNMRFLVREIIKSLRNREAQAVEFSQLRPDSPLYDLAKRRPAVFCRDHFTPVQTHRYLTLRASFDVFFSGLSSKCRADFRRRTRMLVRDFPGRIRFESIKSECDVDNFAYQANEISEKSYKHALGVGFVNDLETLETLHAAAQREALRACLLYVGERPIAFATGILFNRTVYATFTGYDPGFRKYSPGLQCMMHLIEESFEPNSDILRFDAGYGDLPFKRALFGSSWNETPVWIFAPSAKGLSLHISKLVSTLLHSLAMRLLGRSHLLRKLKKMWHRQALQEFQRKGFVKGEEGRDAVDLKHSIHAKDQAIAK